VVLIRGVSDIRAGAYAPANGYEAMMTLKDRENISVNYEPKLGFADIDIDMMVETNQGLQDITDAVH